VALEKSESSRFACGSKRARDSLSRLPTANCQPPTANYSEGVALEEREQQQLCEQQQVGEGMALLG
jgi:hypothetical protein